MPVDAKRKPAAAAGIPEGPDYERHPVERLIALTCYVVEAGVPPTLEDLKASLVYAAELDSRKKDFRTLYSTLIIPEECSLLARSARKGRAALESEAACLERVLARAKAGRKPASRDLERMKQRLEGFDEEDEVCVELMCVPVIIYRAMLDNIASGAIGMEDRLRGLLDLLPLEIAETRRVISLLGFVESEMADRETTAGNIRRVLKTVRSRRVPSAADLAMLEDRLLSRDPSEEGAEDALERRNRRYHRLLAQLGSGKALGDGDRDFLARVLQHELDTNDEVLAVLRKTLAGGPLPPAEVEKAAPLVYDLGMRGSSLLEEKRETARVRAMFERDKTALLEMGVPIEVVERGDGLQGYRISQGRQEELKLTDRERYSLSTAVRFFLGSGTPFGGPAMTLLLKLGYRSGGDVSAENAATVNYLEAPVTREALNRITDALRRRKQVTFKYRSVNSSRERKQTVNPYGLISIGGYWYLVGHSERHGQVRSFKLDRMDSKVKVNEKSPKSPDFSVPEGFDVVAATRWSWEDTPMEARVRYGPKRDASGNVTYIYEAPPESSPTPARDWKLRDDDSLEVAYEIGYAAFFVNWLLGFGTDARVVHPPELVHLMKERLEGVAEAVK